MERGGHKPKIANSHQKLEEAEDESLLVPQDAV